MVSRSVLIAALVFFLVAGLGTYWTRSGQLLYRDEQRFYMTELINAQVTLIERRLQRSISASRILAQAVHQTSGRFHDFDTFAAEMLRAFDGVSNLQLAPDGVVRYVYPLAGNEAALGHDLLADPQRRAQAQQAIKERATVLAGPFELIQGGVAVIGRHPVFLHNQQGERFWGFATMLMLIDDLLSVTELHPEGAKGYSYELYRVSLPAAEGEAEERRLFARSSTPLTPDSYRAPISVPGGIWELVMSRSTPTPKWRSTTGYIVSPLAGLLIAWFTFLMLRQPETLRRIVREKTEALAQLAYHDPLTDLANRRYLIEKLEQLLLGYPRYEDPAVLMYLDLDDFKRVNDSMGHEAGDRLLREVGTRLKGCVRSTDMVARLGGDEFAILLLHTESVRDMGKIAEKVIATIEQPVNLGARSFVVSSSVGITVMPADGLDVATVMSNADMAMYAAKQAGKRNFSFYDQSLQEQALSRLQLEEDLAQAISQEQLVLHYQPLVELEPGRLEGYEALLRWQHPREGLLYPDRFVGVAESTGLIIEIGYWVLAEVCRQLKSLEPRAELRCRFAVNLSPRQFRDPQLLQRIRGIIREADIDARRIEMEVTESSLMDDVDNAVATLSALREMGIRVAIDDFGTGYSSFAQLKNLPVDRLKIDRSFIIDLDRDPSDKKIVQGLISMAHKLQLEVVAEGVETAAQEQLLRSYGCDLVQGYRYGKPLPMNEQPLSVEWQRGAAEP